MKIIFVVMVCFLSLYAPSALQAQDDRARVAQAYEQSGDFKSAARLWQSLYTEYPQNEGYFFSVVRSVKALNNYQSLLDIVQEKLKHKRTAAVLNVYAQVLFKSGRLPEADDAWAEALKLSAASAALYKEIASSQVEVQSADRAITTLLKARSTFDNEALFADELAKLYASKGDFRHGIQEVLLSFNAQANLQQAEGRLSAFMVNDTAITYLREQIQKHAEERDGDYAVLRLYEWVLRETKHYDEAFTVVQRIDKLIGAKGRELLNFAEQARQDAQLDVAAKAYSAIISMGKNSDVAPFAAFGYAACVEARTSDAQTMSTEQSNSVIALYRELVSEFPGSTTAADAQLRIARIHAQMPENAAQAIREYQTLINGYQRFAQSVIGMVELGNVYVQLDDLQHAMQLYQTAMSAAGTRAPKIEEMARFQSAELLFFSDRVDSALQMYRQLSDDAESEFANDAIERMTTISLNRTDTLLLRSFATATLRQAQRRYADALAAYREVYSQKQNMDLAELSLVKAAEVQLLLKQYPNVREHLVQLAQLNPETMYGDRALMLTAASYVAEGNKQDAIRMYEDLLAKFPRSQFVQEAREKVRKLRPNS